MFRRIGRARLTNRLFFFQRRASDKPGPFLFLLPNPGTPEGGWPVEKTVEILSGSRSGFAVQRGSAFEEAGLFISSYSFQGAFAVKIGESEIAYLRNFSFWGKCAFHNRGFRQVKQGREFRGQTRALCAGAKEGPLARKQDDLGWRGGDEAYFGRKKAWRWARLFCLPLCYGLVTSLRFSWLPFLPPSSREPSLLPFWPEPSWPPSLLLSLLPTEYLS
jgi:hypothetical protein